MGAFLLTSGREAKLKQMTFGRRYGQRRCSSALLNRGLGVKSLLLEEVVTALIRAFCQTVELLYTQMRASHYAFDAAQGSALLPRID